MAKPYQEGRGWSVRLRCKGRDLYLSGFKTAAAARQAAAEALLALEKEGQPAKLGPQRTCLAVALQSYAQERLPFLKGAEKDVNRINRYLRAVGLPILRLTRVAPVTEKGGTVLWRVECAPEQERAIPRSLKRHRTEQQRKTINSDRVRARLARTLMADITPYQLQELMDAMAADGYQPATIALERSELRRLFNHARKNWLWSQPGINPASSLKLPPVHNARDRVLSNDEWQRLCDALKDYGNPYVIPAFALLLETAMRSSEPLTQATWQMVDWERRILRLKDAKAGPRDVPLTPGAIAILQTLKMRAVAHGPDEHILPTSYEALKRAWVTACRKAGIEDARPHDLRHTAATRFALEYQGNLPVLKLITGHKTVSQLMRYVNIKADDVVRLMHGEPASTGSAPAGLSPTHLEKLGLKPMVARDTETKVPPGAVVQVDFVARRVAA